MGPVPLLVQVSVRKRHQPPAHGEQQPAADKRRGEDDQREAPFQVDQRGEDVLQESALLADVLVRQVARAVFGDKARFVHAVPEHGLAGQAGGEARQTELLRDDAFSRQHLLLPMVKEKNVKSTFASSVRLYARTQHVHLQENAQRRTLSSASVDIWGCLAVTVARRLCSAPLRGWDDLLSPVDVVQLPESSPGQTRVPLASRTVQGPSENTKFKFEKSNSPICRGL